MKRTLAMFAQIISEVRLAVWQRSHPDRFGEAYLALRRAERELKFQRSKWRQHDRTS